MKPFLLEKKLINTFTKIVMKKGRKQKAETLLFKIANCIRKEHNEFPFFYIKKVSEAIRLTVGLQKITLRGTSHKSPFLLKKDQQTKTPLKWLVSSAEDRKVPFVSSLLGQFTQILLNQGDLMKKREEIFNQAKKNKIFAHHR